MSNALWWATFLALSGGAEPASGPASQAAEVPGPLPFLLGLVAVGLCLLAAWVVRRIARPAKFTLRTSPGRPNALNPGHILVVMLLLWGASGLLNFSLRRTALDSPQRDILGSLGVQAVWLAASLVVGAAAFAWGLRRGMGLTGRRWILDSLRGVWAFLAVYPLCFGLLLLSEGLLNRWGLRIDEHKALRMVTQVTRPWLAVLVFSTVVVAPLTEEVFFRGLLQSMLRRYTGRPWVAILAASAVFAILHDPYYYSIPPLLALGVAIGYNYERTGRLWAPVLIHALFNALYMGLKIAGS